MTITKTCKKCKVEKCLTLFPKTKKSKDGRIARCKVCTNLYAREYQQKKEDMLIAKLSSIEGTNDLLTKDGIRNIINSISPYYNNDGMKICDPQVNISMYYDKIPNAKLIKHDMTPYYNISNGSRSHTRSTNRFIDVTNIDIENINDEDLYVYKYSVWF